VKICKRNENDEYLLQLYKSSFDHLSEEKKKHPELLLFS
jgi:hypothetical protein